MKERPISERRIPVKPVLLTLVIFFCVIQQGIAIPEYEPGKDSPVTSTQQQAIAFINNIKELKSSVHWPNIKPALFLKNINANIHNIPGIYPGNSTNFCGYGAVTYLFLLDDPLGYAKLLLQLYNDGKATFRNIVFNPSPAIKKTAGLLKFKGILDIHPAEQMWFLTLADHYKGYLNLFNRKYDPDDENKFWASCNYAKFNRMVRNLLNYKLKARGSDLIRPRIGDQYEYISEKMKTGAVILFINNRIVYKRNHVSIKLSVPTHFIVAEKVSMVNGIITLVYWDYGHKTLLQLSPEFFKRIIFGISYCTKNEADAD